MTSPVDIVLGDDGVPFTGSSVEGRPLGGAESSFIGLAEGLAARGHNVQAFTMADEAEDRAGVAWRPLSSGLPAKADLYIANRGHRLLDLLPAARRTAFWLHNPARYVLKPRYLRPLWRRRPALVFQGPFHATTLPGWVPGGPRYIMPPGLHDSFRHAVLRAPPPPRAVFTSNPMRRLDWLLTLWSTLVRPRVPGAELHVYSSLATYDDRRSSRQAAAAGILSLAEAMSDSGVVLRAPLPKPELAKELEAARVLLYGGDPGETFCLAVAESQAMGVPSVVSRSTCLAERVIDGETGFVMADEDIAGFATRAIALLTDDQEWSRQHGNCLARQRGLSWQEAAQGWERLLAPEHRS